MIANRPSLPPRFFAAWPRAWLGLSLCHLGRFAEALRYAEEGLQIAEEVDHLHTLIESYSALGGVHLEQGNLDLALRAFERGIELLRPHNVSDANLLSGLGHSYALSGRLSEAVSLLEDSTQREVSISSTALGLSVRTARLPAADLVGGRAGAASRRTQCGVVLFRKNEEPDGQPLPYQVLTGPTA